MEQIDLSEIQELLDDILGGTVDFQQLVEQGTSGQSILSWGGILHDFGTIFLQELVMQKRLWVHVLLLAVASAVLLHFAEVFKNRSVSQISFAMIYMILLLILMVSFQNSMEIARDVLLAMRNFMTVLAPAYFLAMTMTSYVASAGVYYEFILLLVSGLQRVLELFVLPCIEIYVLLVMVDHLSGEERLSRLPELLEMVVGWSLKEVVAAHDAGTVINPKAAEGQIEGGVVMGLGYGLTEDFPMAGGYPTLKYGKLGLKRANDVPEIKVHFVNSGNVAAQAYGAKGIGEICSVPTAPACEDAYYRLDGRVRTVLPLPDTFYRKS